MKLSKYSVGVGDRFGHQAKAQLQAIIDANQRDLEITPVWNKSNREHTTTKTRPQDTRLAADKAVKELGWSEPYWIDADHINLSNVANFIESSDFFTIDIAEFIGIENDEMHLKRTIEQNGRLLKPISIPNMDEEIKFTREELEFIIKKYLPAITEAGAIYRYIEDKKGRDNFVAEISIDEVEEPQSPEELLVILSLIAFENIPIQTIAPRFTGRFNKGVDYVGDLAQFEKEFEEDILVIDYAIREFGLPENLKLSIHSGSDKFSIYPIISKVVNKYNKGFHIKTAGTTWLEEVIGLAMSGGEALELVKTFYSEALSRMDELCAPYAQVIDIDKQQLPTFEEVQTWSSEKFANTLRHSLDHPDYNPNFRQLLHVGYKLAVEHYESFNRLLKKHEGIIGQQVYDNLYYRHLERLFKLKQ